MFGQSLTTRVRDTRLKAGHSDVRVCANARPTANLKNREVATHGNSHLPAMSTFAMSAMYCAVLLLYCTVL